MDGASSAATILQLIQVASQVTSAVTQYAISVKEAESSRQKLVEYLSLVSGAAAAVKAILESSCTRTTAHDVLVKQWFRDDGPQIQCKKALDDLLSELSTSASKRMSWVEKLKWPVKEKKINSKIQVFERHRPYFDLVLQIDIACKTKDIRDSQNEIKQLTENVDRGVQSVGQTVSCLVNDIATERNRSKIEQVDAGQRAVIKAVIEWFEAVDCTVKHESTRRLRQRETCTWLFSVPSFLAWRERRIPFLWLNGIAGSGKSVLASAVIDEVERGLLEGETLARFYFDFRFPRTMSAMEALRSLTVQFLHSATGNWLPMFSDLIMRKERGAAPPADVDILVQLLRQVMQLHQRPIVVIDALDECKDREELLEALTKLNDGHVQLFCVSRPEVVIKDAFCGQPAISLSVMEGPLLEDMRRHITAELECRRNLKKLRAGQKEEIQRLLLEKAQGMFRWVQCQLDRLQHCRSTGDVDHVLHTLPSGLFETYDRILRDIEEREVDTSVVRRALLWLLVAGDNLTLSELWEGLKIDLTRPVLDDAIAPMHEEDILDICGSLISFDEKHKTVTLSHYTVQEYLTHIRPISGIHTKYVVALPEAHLQIAKLWMHYVVVCMYQFEFVRVQLGCPLLEHAAGWGPSRIVDIPDDDDSIIPFLIAHEERLAANQCKLRAICRERPPYVPSALRTVIRHGSTWLLQRYLDQYPICSDNRYSPVVWAAEFDKVTHAKLLLDHGVDVNAKGEDFMGRFAPPLEIAVRRGNVELVKLFLERGSRVPRIDAPCNLVPSGSDLRSEYDRTLLHVALEWPSVGGNCLEIMKLLVEAGCAPESLPCRGHSLLVLAAARGRFDVAEWLLDRGCQLPADFLPTAFQLSRHVSLMTVVEWSRQHGVMMDSQTNDSGDNALHILIHIPCPTRDGSVIEIAKSLIDAGCNVNSQNAARKLPLDVAVEHQDTPVVEYLINRGARVHANIVHSLMNTPMVSDFELTLQALIKSGLDVNEASASVDSAGSTLLHALCSLRAQSIQRLSPCSPGERWSEHDDNINDPYVHECLSEHPLFQRFHLLQQAGFDLAPLVNVKNRYGFTALRVALDSELPSPQFISYLVDLGETFANVNHLPLENVHWAVGLPWYDDAVTACRRATTSQSMIPHGVREVRDMLAHRLKLPSDESRHIVDRITELAEFWACTSITHRNISFGRDTTQVLSMPEYPPYVQKPVVQRIVFSYAGKYCDGRAVERRTGISRSIWRNGIIHETLSNELELKRFSIDRGFYWTYHTTTEVFWDRRHPSAKGSTGFELAPGDALVLKRNAPEDARHWERLEAELELEFYRIDVYYSCCHS